MPPIERGGRRPQVVQQRHDAVEEALLAITPEDDREVGVAPRPPPSAVDMAAALGASSCTWRRRVGYDGPAEADNARDRAS